MSDIFPFLWEHIEHIITYGIELVVLLFILKELRELKRHSNALDRHESKLDQVRPLLSTLYTDSDEILQLAIKFTSSARKIQAVGTISVLAQTEMRVGESEEQWQKRINEVSPLRRQYATTTHDFILSGRSYCRVMNFSPSAVSDPELLLELKANVNFFLRAMQDIGTKTIDIRLFHNPTLDVGREDFHYRVSDSMVIIRVGGPTKESTNAAIAISDTKVVATFAAAHEALQTAPLCREITLPMLKSIDEYLTIRDFQGLENLLDEEDR